MARYKQIGNERIQLTAEEETALNAKKKHGVINLLKEN